MSGTSLDGLDLCLVRFNVDKLSDFEILNSSGISFPNALKSKLSKAHELSGLELALLSNEFALFCATEINRFKETSQEINLIASHGHTVFHAPELGLTTQIGNGAIIYAQTGIKTVSDFRTVDVALGGQGAPLVPIGDLLLFPNYDACLNLGGIANISYKTNEGIIAQDLCFANMLLNKITRDFLNIPYDSEGEFASKGKILAGLLNKMTLVNESYNRKSLGRENFEEDFLKFFENDFPATDFLRTSCEYISSVITKSINEQKPNSVLLSGGGAFNTFLINLIKEKSNHEIILPSHEIIEFKEALIFAFLGVKRVLNQTNCLKSVTSSKLDNVGGSIYG